MAEGTETDAEQVMCRLGHPFEPGIDMDDPEHPDPRWCNVCGTVAGPAPEPTQGSFVPVLPGYYEEVARRLAATAGVPDEPGDDDPKAWAKRIRSNLTEVLDAEEVEQWAGLDEPGVQRFHLLAASHEKLRAEVERLRTATGSECEPCDGTGECGYCDGDGCGGTSPGDLGTPHCTDGVCTTCNGSGLRAAASTLGAWTVDEHEAYRLDHPNGWRIRCYEQRGTEFSPAAAAWVAAVLNDRRTEVAHHA